MRAARQGKLVPCACAVALMLATAGVSPGAPRLRLVRRHLQNGVDVIVARMPGARLAAVDIWLRAGSACETADERGAAHFLEHMLFKGTPSRGRGEIDAGVERCGGLLNAGTLRDAAHVFTTVDGAYVGQVLEVIADAVQHPALDPGEFELERTVILDEFARNRRDAGKALYDAAFAVAYAGRPEGLPILGDPSSIGRLKREAVVAFHARQYRPAACVVVLAGGVEEAPAFDAAERAFGSWQGSASSASTGVAARNSLIASSPPHEPASFVRFVIPGNDSEGARAVRVWRTPPASSAGDVLTAEVVANLLDQQVASRAGARAGAEAVRGQRGGLLVAWHATADREADRKIEALVARLVAGQPGEVDVEACRRRVLAARLYEAETAQGLAREIGMWAMYGDPALPLEVAERLQRTTPAQVHEFAKRWLVAGKPAADAGRTP